MFVALSTIQVATLSSKAESVTFNGFTGELTTTLTSGIAFRTEANDCRLISGTKIGLKGLDTAAIRAPFAAYVDYTPDGGNGGCNVFENDAYGNTSSKAYERSSANVDDGKLNFGRGDAIDAGQSLSLSFTGRHQSGASINLSAVAMVNPALSVNNEKFKVMSEEAKDNFETTYKLGNAYITTPVSDTVDVTIGNYVQSQGATALFPIGVNVVNPVSLPLLRSPGAQLKDALLPQAMVGVTAYTDSGISVEAYYQLEQKEVELDSAGSFWGNDFVGVGEQSGIISAASYREGVGASNNNPFAGNYHDVATCLSDGVAAGATGCADSGLWAGIAADGSGEATMDGEKAGYDTWTALTANNYAGLLAMNADFDALATSGYGGAHVLLAAAPGVTSKAMTNAQIGSALARLASQYPGVGVSRGLVNIHQAPQAKADDSGQYGINLTGYLPDVGQGVEWGLYYNNSHSNAPRIRMLGITDGYATTMYGLMNAIDSTRDFTDGSVTTWEQHLGSIAYSSLILGVVNPAMAYGDYDGTAGTASYVYDPEAGYAAINYFGSLAYAADQANPIIGARTYGLASQGTAGLLAAIAATHNTATAASKGALATLSYVNGARYQQYYPEDIQTVGASLSTGLDGGIAANFEVAFRPNYPLQLDVSALTNNLIDSTGGTSIQNLVAYGSATAANQASIAAHLGTSYWSPVPLCDLSSTTGKASATMSGYNECDGTAEFDVWSFNTNLAKSFRASDPLVVALGADTASGLLDIGAVYVPDLNMAQGLVASSHDQSGVDTYGGACQDAAGTMLLSAMKNGLFGNNYCENNAGPDDFALSYKIRASATYNNFNNSAWSFSPSFGWNHDVHGDSPSSMGGFVEGKMSGSLGATFALNQLSANVNYSAQLGDYDDNKSSDMDYVSATLQYAF